MLIGIYITKQRPAHEQALRTYAKLYYILFEF